MIEKKKAFPDLGVDVDVEGKYKIIWSLESNRTFSVKSLCKMMLESNGPYFSVNTFGSQKLLQSLFPCLGSCLWRRFQWRSCFKRKNFNLASRCALFPEEEESIVHLFVHCQWVFLLWSLALFLMGVSWIQPCNVKDFW